MSDLGNKEIFSRNLRAFMQRHGKDRKQVCDDLGFKYTTFNDWYNGNKYPRIDKIEMLANYFSILKSDLIEDKTATLGNVGSMPSAITPKGFDPLPEMTNVPLIGSIACGTPILADENIESYIGVPSVWHADFALTCHGDSMAPTIQDGDIVCIRSTPEVEDGAIAAVRIGEEATLKHFYKSGDVVQLIADNPAVSPPMAFSGQQLEEIAIEGIAVGLCRGLHK